MAKAFDPERLKLRRRLEVLKLRSRVLHAIRSFFFARDFFEVETPLRLPAPALELHIDAIPADEDYYLRTSPELHMKRLLAAGAERIFQLGPCFRAEEQGELHHPEFCMLEWYRAEADSTDILADTKALILHVAREVIGRVDLMYQGREIDLVNWERITVQEAFLLNAGWDPVAAYDADRFDLDLVNKVEPALPQQVPVVLTDYPAEAAALARRRPSQPSVAERWELYIGGLELANAYGELTDADEQEARFQECAEQRRALGKPVYPIDKAFLRALRNGMPDSGGIALGVDRLVMLLADAADIGDVVAFRE